MSLQLSLKSKSIQPSNYLSVGKDSEKISETRQKSLETLARYNELNKFKQNNSLSLEERLYDARALCKIKTSEISMHLDNEWRRRFFSQLDNLMDIENWEDDDAPITVSSFTTLLRMLTAIKPVRRPGLGATSEGNIIAAWTVGSDRLTIQCLPEDRARWVLSRVIDGSRESAAGESGLTRLEAVLSPYNPEIWFTNGS
jgi:hypothetical protein